MLKKVEDILNKIQHLQDLRQAIKVVASAKAAPKLNKDESKEVKSEDKKEAKDLAQAVATGLQHMGIEMGKGSIISHVLKHPNSKSVYKINVDMGNKDPIFTVSHFDGDEPKELSPDYYKTIEQAVKAATKHFYNKDWK